MRHEAIPPVLVRPGPVTVADLGRVGVALEPVVELASGAVVGHRALARWQELAATWAGSVLPPAADGVADRAFHEAVFELAIAATAGRGTSLTVPVTVLTATCGALPAIIGTAIVAHGRPAGGLRLAVDAEAVRAGGTALRRAAHRLDRDLGIGWVVGGLGAAHLSWRELSTLPLVGLEVAAEVVRDRARASSRAVLRAVAATAAAWDLEVVAAGVDDAGALTTVAAAGCTHARGVAASR